MTIHLNDVWAACGGLAAVCTVLVGIFAGLRYIIRAETAELRPNGGGSMKDAIHRIEVAGIATNEKLDQHIADANTLVLHGAKVEQELRKALGDMAQAMPIVAASTPPTHEEG